MVFPETLSFTQCERKLIFRKKIVISSLPRDLRIIGVLNGGFLDFARNDGKF